MTFWIFTFVLSLIVFVALIYSGRPSRPDAGQDNILSKTEDHFKVRLQKIDDDLESKKLSVADADDARAELARELMRHRAVMSDTSQSPTKNRAGTVISVASFAVVALAFVTYFGLGTPISPIADLDPAQLLAQSEAEIEFQEAMTRVEEQTRINPDDIRAWQVLSSAYVNSARYSEAANAFRHILRLEPPTADRLTDLAQALLMISPAEVDPRAIELLKSAVELEPTHPRSRFFLAVDATRLGEWDSAIEQWNSLLELASDDEPWVQAARESLEVALARGETDAPVDARQPNIDEDIIIDAAQADQIRSMVASLDARLASEGGTIEEWTQLVRSYLVLNEREMALQTYEKAIAAYPDVNDQSQLRQLAEQENLL
ncbi:MAG: c-type cytochrome biogenesis protein CcmI [Devosiaceae bacterium]|nr:c-type cytochrome biogenesis protein CcmI [Devosiaceae bacterium]